MNSENLCAGPCLCALESSWIRNFSGWLCSIYRTESLALPFPRTCEDQAFNLYETLIISRQISSKAFLPAEAVPSFPAYTVILCLPLATHCSVPTKIIRLKGIPIPSREMMRNFHTEAPSHNNNKWIFSQSVSSQTTWNWVFSFLFLLILCLGLQRV